MSQEKTTHIFPPSTDNYKRLSDVRKRRQWLPNAYISQEATTISGLLALSLQI